MAGSVYDHRASMKTAATNVTGGGFTLTAARIRLGYNVLAANAAVLKQLAAEGPLLLIGSGAKVEHEPIGSTRISTFEIPSSLWVGFTRESDNTLVNLETLLEALDEAWIDWPTQWDAPIIDVRQTPAIAHVMLTSRVRAGC